MGIYGSTEPVSKPIRYDKFTANSQFIESNVLEKPVDLQFQDNANNVHAVNGGAVANMATGTLTFTLTVPKSVKIKQFLINPFKSSVATDGYIEVVKDGVIVYTLQYSTTVTYDWFDIPIFLETFTTEELVLTINTYLIGAFDTTYSNGRIAYLQY